MEDKSFWLAKEEPDPRSKKRKPLPKPNVVVPAYDAERGAWTVNMVRGMIINPIYTGLGPYSRTVGDEMWIEANLRLLREDGPEQYLVNLLYVLKESLGADS